jgi:signal peptidase II
MVAPDGVVLRIAGSVFIIDLFLKTYLRTYFAFRSIPLIPRVLHITVVFNTGAAFSILREQTLLLIYLSIIFISFFLILLKKEKNKSQFFLIATGLILGGALSNLCDRIFLGYVVDYIDIRIWPVFNLSDSCISIGAILLFINSAKRDGKHIQRF